MCQLEGTFVDPGGHTREKNIGIRRLFCPVNNLQVKLHTFYKIWKVSDRVLAYLLAYDHHLAENPFRTWIICPPCAGKTGSEVLDTSCI
jgi:hypothetical protein